MKEQWKNYVEDEIPFDNYEVSEVVQNAEGTKIVLCGSANILTVKFVWTDSLRITDEGRRIRTYNEVKEIQEYRKNFYGNPLYIVENSEFVEWIKLEMDGFYMNKVHYVIMTLNDIVDVLATDSPEITIEKSEKS